MPDCRGSRANQVIILGHNQRTPKHEVGHHVFLNRLPEAAREWWRRFSGTGGNRRRVPTGRMLTDYAGTDAGEGFAEAYEFFRDGRPLDPQTRQLVEDLLGEVS